MINYTNTETFLIDLKRDYPERLLYLLEIEYVDEELLDYIHDRDVVDFYPQLFKDLIRYKRTLNTVRGTQIQLQINSNPITGDLYLNQSTNTINVYDGNSWVVVS